MAVKFPSISFLVLSALVILSAQVAHGDYVDVKDDLREIDIDSGPNVVAIVVPIVSIVIVIIFIWLACRLCCACCRSPTTIRGAVLSFPQQQQQQQQQVSQIFISPMAQPLPPPPHQMISPQFPPPPHQVNSPQFPPSPPPQYSQQPPVYENPHEEGFVNPTYQLDPANKAPPTY